MKSKVLKMVGTKTFVLSLVETVNSEYVVECETPHSVGSSLPMKDYKIASLIFDLKLQELEGN
jgi:hypothetical protein